RASADLSNLSKPSFARNLVGRWMGLFCQHGIAPVPQPRSPPVKHSLAIAALVATSFGTLATLPAIAQPAATEIAHRGPGGGGHFMMRGGFGPGFAGFFCREGAAEFVEVSLVRLAYRLDLTEEQRPLFDSFRDTALAAQA